ncbi:hypothetical protein L873DRAFT_1817244 [Choiromyces venosus 120613-1]|uniref:Uncharacterized protein n=1 Tax=Choiromyces venosus 120613-1 TaxID=1336337 RepID=A0A3N4J7T7_9PEZI|nr:hypothetical protein L873DRAFT_1817244 [Choiromyces venosus 120613-1]
MTHPPLYPNYISTPPSEIPTPGTNSPLSITPTQAQTNNPVTHIKSHLHQQTL